MVKVTDKDFYMEPYTRSNLDIIAKHIKKDWFFMILVSGSGITRVGKSVLAQQIAYYLAWKNGVKFDINQIYWHGEEVMKKAVKLPKWTPFIYDEAKGGLDSKRAMETLTKNLTDFFAEAGQLNLLPIVVIPDFFDFKKEIAVTQSICLFNVYYKGEFKRGYYGFYSADDKRALYYKGKLFRNYFVKNPSYRGYFPNKYMVDETEYRRRKRLALKRAVADRVVKGIAPLHKKWKEQRDVLMKRLHEDGLSYEQISNILDNHGVKLPRNKINAIINPLPKTVDLDLDEHTNKRVIENLLEVDNPTKDKKPLLSPS